MIDLTMLRTLTGNSAPGVLDKFVEPLNQTMARFSINTPRRAAAFLAQLVHESGGFRSMVENLNYTPAALRATWPSRFTVELAQKYGRVSPLQPAQQEHIANIAYGGRMCNGPRDSGDGWRYRGRGPIQITGKDNYRACGRALGLDLVATPGLLLNPREGCLAAGWYWDQGNPRGRSLNPLADAEKIDDISRAINGGEHGLAARRSLYEQALELLS